jgi:DNA-binding transcriptional regulator YiaG
MTKPKPMSAKQFSQNLTKLGFTQSSFARAIGVTDRMVRNWVSGAYPVPLQTALLVNLMIVVNTSAEDYET